MKYELSGGNTCPLATVTLDKGESIKVENGAMVYMKDVTIAGKMNSSKKGLGGLLGAIGRSLTSGESMLSLRQRVMRTADKLGLHPQFLARL